MPQNNRSGVARNFVRALAASAASFGLAGGVRFSIQGDEVTIADAQSVASPVSGNLVRADVNDTSATIVADGGIEWQLQIPDATHWSRSSGQVIAGEQLAAVSGASFTAPSEYEMSSTTLNAITGNIRPDQYHLSLDNAQFVINSPGVRDVTLGPDSQLGIAGPDEIGLYGPRVAVAIQEDAQRAPHRSVVVSDSDISYRFAVGTLVGQDGSLLDVSPRGVTSSRAIVEDYGSQPLGSGSLGSGEIELTDRHLAVIDGGLAGDVEIFSPNPQPIEFPNQPIAFGNFRPLNGQVAIGRGNKMAIVDTFGERGVGIEPSADAGNLLIGFSDGQVMGAQVSSNATSIALVPNEQMGRFANDGIFFSYPVADDKVEIDGQSYSLSSPEVVAGYFPILQGEQGGNIGLVGAPFSELMAMAQRSRQAGPQAEGGGDGVTISAEAALIAAAVASVLCLATICACCCRNANRRGRGEIRYLDQGGYEGYQGYQGRNATRNDWNLSPAGHDEYSAPAVQETEIGVPRSTIAWAPVPDAAVNIAAGHGHGHGHGHGGCSHI